ncbi:MAG TPA: NAD-dependent epimerase/dehydratase family protein [Polyangia bacterium]|nr:NAD-dependent epimerase/dehydratase family protein [Polyangia bacterium]
MRSTAGARFFIVGGAGFIGSHFTDHLLGEGGAAAVTLYDNFSSGREWHYAHHARDPRLMVVRGQVEDTEALKRALDPGGAGHDVVIHLASNPDIARAAREPTIDFWQGTALTNSVVEAMRCTSARRILYASGSGVYGDLGSFEAAEDHGPLLPASTYGASKLAGESLISSYAAMFGLSGCAFRFGNVVGPRQTHGVGFDFARRLMEARARDDGRAVPIVLKILGDGKQSKSYVHISDIVRAVLAAHERTAKDFEAYNVATGDYITVTEIAALAVECVGLPAERVRFEYTGGDRGWKGDVPVVRLDTARIRSLGWQNRMGSREALRQSMLAMIPDMAAGRM